jgi:hypothetical protein
LKAGNKVHPRQQFFLQCMCCGDPLCIVHDMRLFSCTRRPC